MKILDTKDILESECSPKTPHDFSNSIYKDPGMFKNCLINNAICEKKFFFTKDVTQC